MTTKKYIYDLPEDGNHALNKILNFIESGSSVFEIGCASGVQSRLLKETLSCLITGLEIDEHAATNAKPYCDNLIVGNIEHIDLSEHLKNKQFDVILFSDVLEHLNNPLSSLKKVKPYLNDNGHLIASIPNIAHAAICWELAHGRFDYQKFGLLDDTHIRFFTRKNIAKLFEEAGYQIMEWDRVIKLPDETEFNISNTTPTEQSFFEWVNKSNIEANTYQYIVKASPALTGQGTTYQEMENLDTIQKLKSDIYKLENRNKKLLSELEWIENNRFGILSRIIGKRFFRGFNRAE